MTIKTYSELLQFHTIEDRYEYLKLRSAVGESTFGFDRYLNQQFYRSSEWKQIRNHVIARDLGCDLGIDGYEIHDRVIIHHMNPMSIEDIEHGDSDILNPEFLITTTHKTHNAIHYGNKNLLPQPLIERSRNDTKLW